MMPQKDIDMIYESMIDQLKRDGTLLYFSLKLATLKTNSQRIEIVYDKIQKYDMFPKITNVKKESAVSIKYRNMGNEEFKNRCDSRALKMYNYALLYAPKNSEEEYLAYSNRSAANFSMNNYLDCLIDIERVMKFDCSLKLREKLNKRKLNCEKALNEKDSTEEELETECKRKFNLSKKQHKNIPAASESIDLFYSEKMGRGVMANQNILPGEVLALEEPYCCLILEPFYLEYCYGCLKQCDSMLPCENCCAVMFCNEECRATAHHKFHKIDCKLMSILSALKFSKIELLALRIVIQAKCTNDNCDSLRKIITEAESVIDPLLRGFLENKFSGKNVLYSDHYSYIHMLDSNVDKREPSDIFQKAVTAAVFLDSLIKHTNFFDECQIDSSKNYFENECVALFGGLLLHHGMTSPSNLHTICTVFPTATTGYTESKRFGGGAYAFHSLLNHSCAPNVFRVNTGSSSMALIALRPIKKGQQIFDNYGYHHATESFQERQYSLRFQYKFVCECEACIGNWPSYVDLQYVKINDKKTAQVLLKNLLTKDLFDDLTKGDRQAALDIINQLYPYVDVLEKSAPCKELADYQETIKQCWALFGNVAPLRRT